MGAVLADHAEFQLAAEVFPEGLVALPVVLHHLDQLVLDFLLQVGGDDL